jgi:hypothetical protein
VFHHHDGIGAFRQRSSCHDLDSFSAPDHTFKSLARAHFANDAKASRDVTGADRKAIAYGPVERRVIPVGKDVFSEDAACRILDDCHRFRRWGDTLRPDFPHHDSTRVDEIQSRHEPSVSLMRPVAVAAQNEVL